MIKSIDNDFDKRLKAAMKEQKVSIKTLSQVAGVSYEMARRYTLGTATPRDDKLELIAKFLKTTPSHLKYGEQESFTTTASEANTLNINQLGGILVDDWDDNTALEDDEVSVPFFKSIELAAGHGANAEEDHNGYKLRFSKAFFRRKGVQKEFVICFPAKGNSMEPVIPNGAVVAVDMSKKEIVDGDIYAICQDGLCRIKRLYKMPNFKVRVNSYNMSEYPDEIAELTEIQIIGRVFHCAFEL